MSNLLTQIQEEFGAEAAGRLFNELPRTLQHSITMFQIQGRTGRVCFMTPHDSPHAVQIIKLLRATLHISLIESKRMYDNSKNSKQIIDCSHLTNDGIDRFEHELLSLGCKIS